MCLSPGLFSSWTLLEDPPCRLKDQQHSVFPWALGTTYLVALKPMHLKHHERNAFEETHQLHQPTEEPDGWQALGYALLVR